MMMMKSSCICSKSYFEIIFIIFLSDTLITGMRKRLQLLKHHKIKLLLNLVYFNSIVLFFICCGILL